MFGRQRTLTLPRRVVASVFFVFFLSAWSIVLNSTPATLRRAAGAQRPLAKPNLILILTDDQRSDWLKFMPRVQSLLAGHGVTFANMFVSSPICCPSRASILTGQYAHNTGVVENFPPEGGASAFRDRSTIATWLTTAGYRTSLIGKYLNGYSGKTIPPGWQDWHALLGTEDGNIYYNYQLNENGKIVSYGSLESDYSTTVLFQRAKTFISASRKPFFLYLAPSAPHEPMTPAPPDVGSFDSLPPFRPPSFNEADVSDKQWSTNIPLLTDSQAARLDSFRHNAIATLQAVDRGVAELVNLLAARGQLDNTIIAFTSDNGYLLGEHRLVRKQWFYEPSIRVPLVFRLPWETTKRIDKHLVLNVDLPRTLATLGRAVPDKRQNGEDLTPLLLGLNPAGRTGVYLEFLATTPFLGRPPPYRGIRNEQWKYIEFLNGWRELYDLNADPDEMSNLAGNPSYMARQISLSAQLAALAAQ